MLRVCNPSAVTALTVSAFACAMLALTRATAIPVAEVEPATEEPTAPPSTDADSWNTIDDGFMGGWRPSCPDGWTMFSMFCLRYVPQNLTWDEAEENCKSMAGNLAYVMDTRSILYEFHEVMQKAGHENGDVWVGGCNTEDSFWSLGISGWLSGEREHTCLRLTPGENVPGCLNETECDPRLPSICSIIIM